VTPVLLDITDEAHIEALTARLADELGSRGLDGLVNNAGIARGGPVEFLPVDEWRTQLDVNVLGQVAVTSALIPQLRRAPGRVVFIGSISGRVSPPFLGPYTASKHAIEAIGEALREELRPWGIGVSVVEPGVVRTPIWGKAQSYAGDLEARLPPQARELYGPQIDQLRAAIDTSAQQGIAVGKVAEVVEHALLSRRPRYRYLVGFDAKAAALAERLLPDRAMAALVRRARP
jgi:NAD(P)-dependent dehydrogenase (short-subunit alcohol dehydrogenase family)